MQFGITIPIEDAVRAAQDVEEKSEPGRLRWIVMRREMARYEMDYHPFVRPVRPDTTATPKAKLCIVCGEPFFAYKQAMTCGRSCGSKSRTNRGLKLADKTELSAVPLEQVKVPPGGRELDPANVRTLRDSIDVIGLKTPIAVLRGEDGRLTLTAGRHRLEACRQLRYVRISAYVFTNPLKARLWTIAENLHRIELTALQRSELQAEWLEVTQVESPNRKRGTRAAARELGLSVGAAQRATKIAGLSADAKQAARAHGLDDNQSALLAAASQCTPDAQVHALADYRPATARREDASSSNCVAWLLSLSDDEIASLRSKQERTA